MNNTAPSDDTNNQTTPTIADSTVADETTGTKDESRLVVADSRHQLEPVADDKSVYGNVNDVNLSPQEDVKKGSVSSHYRLRKRRSAYLRSDTSSDDDTEKFHGARQLSSKSNDINSAGTTSGFVVWDQFSTANPLPATSSVMGDGSFGLISTDTSYPAECSDPLKTTLTPRMLPIVGDAPAHEVVMPAVGVDSFSSHNLTQNCSSQHDPFSSATKEMCMCDFVEKHPAKQPKPVDYPCILRLFALQYTTFPARVIGNRFTPVSYEQNDNVKPDYKLISPFIYYFQEFTPYELSFYCQMLTLLMHSKICRTPQVCMNRLCVGYQAIVLHLKQCSLFKCKNVYCFTARLVFHHVITCSKALCKFCPAIPMGVVDYCKSYLYSNDPTAIKFSTILKSCFSSSCLSIRNEDFNVSSARKILNHIFNDYLCIDKNSYADKNNKVLATVDRNKVINDMVRGFNTKKIDVSNDNQRHDCLLVECTKFEQTLYRHSHNKDIYLQSVANVGLMFQFFSQIMIKTDLNPLEELAHIATHSCVLGSCCPSTIVSDGTGRLYYLADGNASMSAHNSTNHQQHQTPFPLNNNTGGTRSNARNLSYGYENTFTFTPTRVFSPKKIADLFLPLIQTMFNSPDGIAFQAPVDPVYYMIYDYYDLISYPMDLHTIIVRLKERFYVDPWEVIHDVWQTFQNAWLYNRRTTRVYKIATRLKDHFLEKVASVTKSLKLCCSYRRVLTPQPLFCMGKDYCVIQREAVYYVYQNYYIYCERCFQAIAGDKVTIVVDEEEQEDTSVCASNTVTQSDSANVNSEDQLTLSRVSLKKNPAAAGGGGISNVPTPKSKSVEKSAFTKETNSKVYMENFVECRKCNRRAHQICKLHTTEIDGIYYYCDDCLEQMSPIPKHNHYTCERLMETHLSSFIETRVNDVLASKLGEKFQPVRIRQVYNNLKKLKTSLIVNEYFENKYPAEFLYQSKALFAFQKLDDGSEICFFGMHVQEFDNEAPEPNRGRVYLSYLDSVHFFQPKTLKTEVYFTILSAYFEFVRRRGFSYVHLWACPPCEGDDYIFHCHPAEQRVPKHKRLVDWYRKLLDECVKSRIFTKIKDLHKYIVTEKRSQLTLIPYFEGDYWPNAFEDVINEVKAEKDPNKVVSSTVTSAAASLRRGRAMLMQNYDQEDNDEDTNNVDGGDVSVVASDSQSHLNVARDADDHCGSSSSLLPAAIDNKVKHPSKFTKKKRSSKYSKRKRPSKTSQQRNKKAQSAVPEFLTVEQRLFNLLERFKDVFFVCRLNNFNHSNNNNNCAGANMAIQCEIDPPIHCDLTDGRSGFLQLCRERKWEFSTLLRTKFTTLGFLVELHIQFGDRFIFTCNNCKCHVFNKYHCTFCPDYDLCYKCFYVYGHEHQMVQVDESNNSALANFNGANILLPPTQTMPIMAMQQHQQLQNDYQVFGPTVSSTVGGYVDNNNTQHFNFPGEVGINATDTPIAPIMNLAPSNHSTNPPNYDASQQQANALVAQELLDIMLHCSTCPLDSILDPCPTNEKCQRMRIAIKHCSECNAPNRFLCPICHSLLTLCVPHAQSCRTPNCRVVFCKHIRERMLLQSLCPSNSNNNNFHPQYQPPNNIAPNVQNQMHMVQMHPHHHPQPAFVVNSASMTGAASTAVINDYTPPPPVMNNAVYHPNYSLATSIPISTTPSSTMVINMANNNPPIHRNMFVAQKDPNLQQYRPNLAPSTFYTNNLAATQMTPVAVSNMNESNLILSMINDQGVSPGASNFSGAQSEGAGPTVPSDMCPPSQHLSSSNGPISKPPIRNQCQHQLPQNAASSARSLVSGGVCSNVVVDRFNPLKNVLLASTPLHTSKSVSSIDGTLIAAHASDLVGAVKLQPIKKLPKSPAVLKSKASKISYLKQVPFLVDPQSNPCIPIRNILAYNLKIIRRLLNNNNNNNNEVNDVSIGQVAMYVKCYPYVLCHLSDKQQNRVVAYLKTKNSAVKLDEKEEALISFLHRDQAARGIRKMQHQYQNYTNNIEVIARMAQEQNKPELKSLWAMPKQQIVDFINNFKIHANNSNTPTTNSANHLTQPASNATTNDNGADGFTASDQLNLSLLGCCTASDPQIESNLNLGSYVKTLLPARFNILSTTTAEGHEPAANAKGEHLENIPLIHGTSAAAASNGGIMGGGDTVAVDRVYKSPLKTHLTTENDLPHVAMGGPCDSQKSGGFDPALL